MTLTQAAIITKRFFYLSILIIFLGSSTFLGLKLWKIYHPPLQIVVEETPKAEFGNLPYPKFPTSSVTSSNFSYSIDTVDGNLPTFDDIIKVFVIPPSFATLLAPDKSQTLAEKLNLIPLPEILSETEYKFTNADSTLLVDLDSGNFKYKKQATLSAQPSTFASNAQLVLDFKSLLASIGYLKDELKEGSTKVVFLKNENDKLIPTSTSQDATAAQISIWPTSIDGKSIYTPATEKSLINAIITANATDISSYLSINYTLWPVDTSSSASYPLKTTYDALDDLKAGKGVIIKEPKKTQVSILNVRLGYYETEEYTPYLQPIYIFEGSDFQAYVPAISNQYYDETE